MKTYTFRLPDEFAAILDQSIAAGRFADVDHFILNAVARYDADEKSPTDAEREWIKEQVRIGIDEADRGEGIPHDVVMARLRAKLGQCREVPR